ncbi:MAG: maleylpyruvate isomerase family mycothiol-dependent enzyme [Acidimicrobiales bacterium]
MTDFVDAHRRLFAHYDDLCARLDDARMATPSLCPGWDVRAVITHTIGVEHVLAGWAPSTEVPPPFEKLGSFEQELVGLDRAGFAESIAATSSARLAELEAMSPGVLAQPSITPTGIATYGRFLQVRVFDLWVHARDIALPLGEATDDTGFAAEAALQEVDDSVGYIVGKKIGLPEGMTIVFSIEGEGDDAVRRDIAVQVDGRATRVDSIGDPDVTIHSDVATFVMLAAGRIDPQKQIDAGRITWSGDAAWGERAARNLAYTR